MLGVLIIVELIVGLWLWLLLAISIGKAKEKALVSLETKKWELARTKELVNRALREYPDARVIDAVHLYYNTKLGLLIRAVSQEQKAELIMDRIYLKREIDRLTEIQIHTDSSFVFSDVDEIGKRRK